ncbi:MAG: hypothetical protein NC132_04565 [Corallococcus sp.]|nr:hypothetical protein [Corallococcus sp.]MCM1359659.1 hypothetical protein [Corallococcus sp.]MCM1395368.1 hypothetical protein [Corallococcus sp.]
MFFNKKYAPSNCKRKIAYADLTDSGKGILRQTLYNGVVAENKLRSAHGLTKIFDHSEFINAVTATPDGKIIFLTTDGVYRWFAGNVTKISDVRFYGARFAYHKSSAALLVSSRRAATYAYKDDSYVKVCDTDFDDIATYCDRCFGLRRDKLYFTERGDVFDWSGSIDLPQEAFALAETSDGIYVVGSDVYLLAFDDNEQESKLKLVYRNVGEIYGRSLRGVGKGFMFLSSSGVRYFNGSNVKTVAYADAVLDSSASAAVCKGCYYVSYLSRKDSGRNYVMAVDVSAQKIRTVYDLSVHCVGSLDSDLFIVVNNSVYLAGNEFIPLFWQSRPYSFGSDMTPKTFETLFIDTACDVTVTLRSESETRILHVKGGKKMQKIPLHGGFYTFTLTLETDGKQDVDVSCVGIAARVIEEVN